MRARKHVKRVKRPTTVFLSPAQRRALEQLAERLDVSMGHLIREGINLILARNKGPQS